MSLQVITNPGTMPDLDLMKECSDITVVFEESHERLQDLGEHGRDVLSTCDRGKTCYVVHSAPWPMVKDITRDLRHRAQYVFCYLLGFSLEAAFVSSSFFFPTSLKL